MPLPSTEQDQKIRQVIRSCGLQVERLAKEHFQVSQKGPDDYVTNVDRALDQELTTAFSNLFPHDGLITEENTQSRQAFGDHYSQLWLIDPLDGTEDFIKGNAEFAIMVGLLQEYQPIAGWVYAPMLNQMYYGGCGWGLFQEKPGQDSERLEPVEPPPPQSGFCPMIIGTKDQNNFGEAIAKLIPDVQFYTLGSFGLKVMEVICGRAGLYVYFNGRVKLWDTTGPLAIAKAAGLVCCDLEGQPIRFTPDALDPDTLAHKQPILVGWPSYIEPLLPKLQKAIGMLRLQR
ncbi:inositol monophosphatase family protein [Trichocoleus desertorum AS-A10]|uniref:3'(2'),5'-bisphosphate nucleotidase CysQ family protein n=1 Tax=Trichocoleus desertorum TaxID=1481672 RepID=UPI003299C475